MRPPLEYASSYGRLLHPRPALTNTLPIQEHLQLHTSQFKQKPKHPSYPLHKHTTYFQHYKVLKNAIFNNGHYTTIISTDPHTVTTTDIKTNMCHIYTPIVSRHQATRDNNKILGTPPTHSSEEILPASLVAPLPNSDQINHPFSNHTYTKAMPNHIHHNYAPL